MTQSVYAQLEGIPPPDVIMDLNARKKINNNNNSNTMTSSPLATLDNKGVPMLDDLQGPGVDVYEDSDESSWISSEDDQLLEDTGEDEQNGNGVMSDTTDPTYGITINKRRGNNRSLAPPDELRYGEEAEEEMHRLDRVMDALEDENEELERILVESKDLIRQNATHHFKQRIEEQSRSKTLGDMLSKRTGPQFLLPTDAQGNLNESQIDDYSRQPMVATESRLLKKFTPSNLALRSSESLSYKNFSMGSTTNGRPTKAAKKLREHLQSSATHVNHMPVVKDKVDLKAMLQEQMEEDKKNKESAENYNRMMIEYSQMQRRIIQQLTQPLPEGNGRIV